MIDVPVQPNPRCFHSIHDCIIWELVSDDYILTPCVAGRLVIRFNNSTSGTGTFELLGKTFTATIEDNVPFTTTSFYWNPIAKEAATNLIGMLSSNIDITDQFTISKPFLFLNSVVIESKSCEKIDFGLDFSGLSVVPDFTLEEGQNLEVIEGYKTVWQLLCEDGTPLGKMRYGKMNVINGVLQAEIIDISNQLQDLGVLYTTLPNPNSSFIFNNNAITYDENISKRVMLKYGSRTIDCNNGVTYGIFEESEPITVMASAYQVDDSTGADPFCNSINLRSRFLTNNPYKCICPGQFSWLWFFPLFNDTTITYRICYLNDTTGDTAEIDIDAARGTLIIPSGYNIPIALQPNDTYTIWVKRVSAESENQISEMYTQTVKAKCCDTKKLIYFKENAGGISFICFDAVESLDFTDEVYEICRDIVCRQKRTTIFGETFDFENFQERNAFNGIQNVNKRAYETVNLVMSCPDDKYNREWLKDFKSSPQKWCLEDLDGRARYFKKINTAASTIRIFQSGTNLLLACSFTFHVDYKRTNA